jgi:hypothetical protein
MLRYLDPLSKINLRILHTVFARYALAFALQLKAKHGKTSVRVGGE